MERVMRKDLSSREDGPRGEVALGAEDDEFFRGSKGAQRIPSLSFQFLRRPGRTTKLLYFQ
jgi:hypothetical protein